MPRLAAFVAEIVAQDRARAREAAVTATEIATAAAVA
jgi:hypothetical protein